MEAKNQNFLKGLSLLKKQSFDVKFDLDNTGYKPVEKIGIGAYGVVCSAVHKKTQKKVAIKKIPNVFDVLTITKRTYREIKILKHFKHDNIISIREILKPKEDIKNFKDIYVVLDLMESDLHQIIYSKQKLTEEHIRYFLYQILRGLKYIHSANVVHRDLKPSNLLVRENCHLRIGDFGMARGISAPTEEPNYLLTQYVATRWYRAPELLFSLLEYSSFLDVWSVGCIFAELLGRRHLFPGKDYISQMKLIIGMLGSPSDRFLSLCQSDMIRKFIKQLGHKEPIAWSAVYPKASWKAIDLLSKMLQMHPNDRVTVEQALKHPYFYGYHDPEDEPICIPAFNFDFEQQDLTLEQMRDSIYSEILEYHQPRAPALSFSAVLRPAPKDGNVQNTISNKDKRSKQGAALQAFVQKLQQRQKAVGMPKKTSSEQPVLSPITMQDGDAVKKAEMKSGDVVALDSQSSLHAPSTDVEMLSAKSSAAGVPAQTQPQELVKQENKTISMDTKALIKAALRYNATLKKSGEGKATNDDKPRPVTAAQRQREREGKRRKRKERALKKMKGKKYQENEGIKLTDADRELLERWKNMQNIKPLTKQQVYQRQQCRESMSEEEDEGEQSVSSVESCSILQEQQQCRETTFVQQQQSPPQPHEQEQTHQERVAAGFASQPQSPPQPCPSEQLCQDRSPANFVQQQQSPPHPCGQVQNVCGCSSEQQSLHQQDRMPATSLALHQIPDQAPRPQFLQNGQQSSSPPTGHQADTQQNLCTLAPAQTQRDFATLNVESLHFLGIMNLQDQQISGLSLNSCTLNSQSKPQLYSGNSISRLSIENNMDSSGLYSIANTRGLPAQNFPESSPSQHFQNSPSHALAKSTSSSRHHQQMTAQSSLELNIHNQQYGEKLTDAHSLQPFGGKYTPATSLPQTLFPNSPSVYENILGYTKLDGPPYILDAQKQINPPGMVPPIIGKTISSSTVPPEILLQRKFSQLPAAQVNCMVTAVNKLEKTAAEIDHPNKTSSSDLITALSKQLSKSQMDDPMPPSLALTPKGMGGGYGVGLDLDALMAETIEGDKGENNKNEPSPAPLSSSLLADWMDVTANMDLQALAAELEINMQSPMALSYSDLNLCSS